MAHDHNTGEAGPGKVPPQKARQITTRTTALSVSVALILVTTKAVAWWASGSVALLASLADSLLDLMASVLTFFAVRFASEPADDEHRFGHGKAEALASFAQALFVALSAGLLLREAWQHITEPRPLLNGGWAIGVMALSIALTLFLVWAQTRAIKKTGSVAVAGDRAHYMADLAANLAVIAGIAAASYMALPVADPLIGAGVGLWLFWSAWQVARQAFDQMLDRELPDADRQKIMDLAGDDDRIHNVHQLRTRAAGPLIHIQMHLDLDPSQTLESAHKIVVEAEKRVQAEYPAADILIHPDPHGKAEPHGLDFLQGETDGSTAKDA